MAVNLQYNGKWLIPLQDGYKVSIPHAGIAPGYAGGHPIGQLARPAVVVDASYHLDDPAMIAWWWALHEANRGGEFVAMLDTAGYLTRHTCRMVGPPRMQEYMGYTALITVEWVTQVNVGVYGPRVTEDDQPRITESGNIRVIEG